MAQSIKSVVIVGGGTAGWMTACTLARNLGSINPDAIQVTLVESPDIPTIGVGEGTWPTMRRTLENIGVNESEFIRECSATFKQGTKFTNWKSANGQSQSYYNLFSSIYDPGEFNLAPYWALGLAGENVSYADAVSAQAVACEQNLAPKKITSLAYDAIQSYAYHLDAGKFADFLKQYAVDKLGVHFIAANMQEVKQNEQGFITAIDTKEQGTVSGDLFIDCTGFRSLLLGQELGIGFVSVKDTLFTDRAMAMQVPYPDEQTEVACVTRSTAQSAGWIWDIGLQNRRGIGHVYSSNHMDDEDAERLLRTYVGEAADGLEARKINMEVGYREKFWHKNCIAIGLSAAFVEPLEASAIFLVEAAGNMLSDLFPRNYDSMVFASAKFNRSFQFRWSRTIDFIKLHYALSGRNDSEFWLDNKAADSIPLTLQENLNAWSHHPVSKYDFSDINEPFPHESYQYILHGMGFKPELKNAAETYPMVDKAKLCFDNVRKATQHICSDLPTHRELLNKVCRYGFQTI